MHIATSYHLSRERHREASGVGDDPWDNKAILEQMVARVFAIELDSICRPTRGRAKVAMARQVAMYLAHVVFALSFSEIGRLWAQPDGSRRAVRARSHDGSPCLPGRRAQARELPGFR